MSNALELLRRILDASIPGATVELSPTHAALLGKLGSKELGDLADQMAAIGEIAALEKYGLKDRKIVIVHGDPPHFRIRP